MNREQWLLERRKCIGASDAAAILGQSPWRSPYAVWAEKCHGITTTEETERMRWGLALEQPIADEFTHWAEENLDAFTHLTDPGLEIAYMPGYPYIGATLDRLVWDAEECMGPLEIKTADSFRSKDWDYAVPLPYQIQLQHQMMVTGHKIGWVAVLIGGNRFRVFEQSRNDKFIDRLLSRLMEFWRLVETQTPPDADGSQSTKAAIQALHPLDNGVEIELPDNEWSEDIEYLQELKEKIKELEVDVAVIENRIRSVMGDATYAHVGDWTFSNKNQTRKAYTVPEKSFRVLRCGKRKDND